MSQSSVTLWLKQLQTGDREAVQRLWERYFTQLVHLARAKLQGRRFAARDEEDIALSAFDSFCRGAEQRKFPVLEDRSNLWRLLVVITSRKASKLVQGEARRQQATANFPADDSTQGMANFVDDQPTPEFAAEMVEEFERLLDRLESAELARIAVATMEGYTLTEIAGQLGCSSRTIDRKLRLIRDIWQEPEADRDD